MKTFENNSTILLDKLNSTQNSIRKFKNCQYGACYAAKEQICDGGTN